MKTYDAYVDDDGVRWELLYEDKTHYETDESGAPVRDGSGRFVSFRVVSGLRYRREGEEEWLALPPWATVRDDAKVTLCFFEEDEETEEMTMVEVTH